jgi:hypothetical protein
VNHQKTNVDGVTVYEYTYEVTKPNGDKVKKIVRQKVSSSKVPRYNSEEHHETVLNSINKYIEENEVKVPNLYKMSNLDAVLKPIQSYIIDSNCIRVNLPILKNFIKKEILLIN